MARHGAITGRMVHHTDGTTIVKSWPGFPSDEPFDNDPCDQMVTVQQVAMLVIKRPPFEPRNPYACAAAILGISRDEAKAAIYRYCYGG